MSMKDDRKFSRKSAFSFKISDPNSSEQDAIQRTLTLNGKLYSFSTESITQITLADEIDPENKEPETRHSYQKLFSIGTSNSFVARTIIQADELLRSLILRDGLNKEEILNHVWNSALLLFSCENSVHSIFKETNEKMYECDKILGQRESAVISSLPQVEELESERDDGVR